MIKLRVNGFEYSGWTTARVVRSIEQICGSFDLSVSERRGDDEPWLQIGEESQCVVLLEGTPVIAGYVDRRSIAYSAESHSIEISGRDKAGALVDCSAMPGEWEYRNVDVVALVRRVAEPFRINVTLQSTILLGTPPAKFSIDPGDSAFDVIDRVCRLVGLLPISDGTGGLLLTRAGNTRAVTALVEGKNILSASAEYDSSQRYSRYVVLGQQPGTDEVNGRAAAQVRGEASDLGVVRTDRVLVVRPEGAVTADLAKKRGQWEAIVRAGRTDSVSVVVQGWTQSDGSIWPINALVPVKSPLLGIDGEMLITSATHEVGERGTTTTMTLKRPDAFTLGPRATVKLTSGWKEIAGGV